MKAREQRSRNSSDKRRIIKPADIAAAAAIIAAAAVFLIINNAGSGGTKAGVFRNGEIIKELSLDKDGVYPFEEYGITVEVKNRSIAVTESDCPDKICVRTGFISSPRQAVVCLPKRISVRILDENKDEQNGVDAVI